MSVYCANRECQAPLEPGEHGICEDCRTEDRYQAEMAALCRTCGQDRERHAIGCHEAFDDSDHRGDLDREDAA